MSLFREKRILTLLAGLVLLIEVWKGEYHVHHKCCCSHFRRLSRLLRSICYLSKIRICILRTDIQIKVGPNIRQCRIIRPDILYPSGKSRIIQHIRQGIPDNTASGKKNQIRPNPNSNF